MKKSVFILFILAVLSVSSCSSYKMDIQQGNVVEQETISQITRGMSRGQVQSILGTSLMQDDFHGNRWDYVFYLKKPGKKPELKSVAIIFNRGAVSQILK